ncbi:hypothetical protein [Kitasatospora sp. NPDC002040]|uniref:hypothetical protein n=1 Tax=Kitasatospora sp. NPDC002040 TaxID=3154661 RepID=UPI0033321AE8
MSRDDRAEASEIRIRLASALTRAGITERYGMDVRQTAGAWGVYLVDREPATPTPAGLVLLTPVRDTRALVVKLLALAA